METINEAKGYLRANFDKGCNCPVCGQNVKLYKRKLYSTMARSLILIYQLNKRKEWIHINEITDVTRITGDFAKLEYWKMIRQKDNKDDDKRTSGYWKITEIGKQFVENNLRVPKYAKLFDSRFYGWSTETISIVEALGKKFSYSELMQN